ncbi:MAG: PLP-dependent transferase, partial [Pseudomonadota bacterium]
MAESKHGFETLALHAGYAPDATTGARAVPIYQTTSFAFEDVDHAASLFNLQQFGNIYSRLTNPTVSILEERVAALEGGVAACAMGSGHAAQFLTFLNLLTPGTNIVASSKLYGGSISQMTQTFPQFGWETKFVDPRDPAAFDAAIDERTRAVFIESASNPDGIVS